LSNNSVRVLPSLSCSITSPSSILELYFGDSAMKSIGPYQLFIFTSDELAKIVANC
jgi:hypothetical protein